MRDSLIEKEKIAIERLKMFEPNANQKPYYLAYSGGKDSDTILILAQLAGVRFEAVNNHTTVDAPETVRYIRSKGIVKVDYPESTMWQLIVDHMIPPTRMIRYCCAELKERGGERRTVITGVRKTESKKRANTQLIAIWNKPKAVAKLCEEMGINEYELTKYNTVMLNNDNEETRELVDSCYQQHKVVLNPILDWTEKDVWEFLHHYGCEGNPLYQCGYERIGCIGCPMTSNKNRYKMFNDYPKYKLNYFRAFVRMLERRKERGVKTDFWTSANDVFKWWMNEDVNQLSFFGEDL